MLYVILWHILDREHLKCIFVCSWSYFIFVDLPMKIVYQHVKLPGIWYL